MAFCATAPSRRAIQGRKGLILSVPGTLGLNWIADLTPPKILGRFNSLTKGDLVEGGQR